MFWEHSVDPEWLQARAAATLTASEIVKMIPEYNRWKVGKLGDISPQCVALWTEKQSILSTPLDLLDINSPSLAAARGHVMEPFAVKVFNKEWDWLDDPNMYHWDDAIIIGQNGIGYSPDSLDIEQSFPNVVTWSASARKLLALGNDGLSLDLPKNILEIKSYGPANHMKKVMQDLSDIDERYQIAAAMSASPSLIHGTVMFYCPDAPVSARRFDYDRSYLSDEIKMANDILSMYQESVRNWCDVMNNHDNMDIMLMETQFSEKDIYLDHRSKIENWKEEML